MLYTVKPGDTLYAIANHFGTTIDYLVKINNINNPDKIQVGQVLKIKTKSTININNNPNSSNNKIINEGKYITANQLKELGWHNINQLMLNDLNYCLEHFHINTKLRICHFLSQCCHESSCGKYKLELSNGNQYNGRQDLGNIYPGDGSKFKGAGYIQLTGRANYKRFSDYIKDIKIIENGCEYVANKYPWTSAGFWWYSNKMNQLCDTNPSVEQITYRVNGGYNGLYDRKMYFNKCLDIIK